jgi:hypothetical protein
VVVEDLKMERRVLSKRAKLVESQARKAPKQFVFKKEILPLDRRLSLSIRTLILAPVIAPLEPTLECKAVVQKNNLIGKILDTDVPYQWNHSLVCLAVLFAWVCPADVEMFDDDLSFLDCLAPPTFAPNRVDQQLIKKPGPLIRVVYEIEINSGTELSDKKLNVTRIGLHKVELVRSSAMFVIYDLEDFDGVKSGRGRKCLVQVCRRGDCRRASKPEETITEQLFPFRLN